LLPVAALLLTAFLLSKPGVFEEKTIKGRDATVSYLINNSKADGTFTYLQTSQGKEDKLKNLYFRQLYAMLAIATEQKDNPNPELRKIHQLNLKSIKDSLKYRDDFAYINNSAEENILTETDLALLTLIASPDSVKYKKDIQKLGNFILRQQQMNGYINWSYPQKKENMLDQKDFAVQSFISGQSIAACSEAYRFLKNEKYLTCAQKAFTYYYSFLDKRFDPTFTSWLIIGTTGLSLVDTDNNYKKNINILTHKLSSHVLDGEFFSQSKELDTNTSEIGLFAEALEKGTHYGSYNKSEYEKLNQTATLGIATLLHNQITSSNKRLHGGISTSSGNSSVQLDNTTHAYFALKEYSMRKYTKIP
jgi:hypothetical protein